MDIPNKLLEPLRFVVMLLMAVVLYVMVLQWQKDSVEASASQSKTPAVAAQKNTLAVPAAGDVPGVGPAHEANSDVPVVAVEQASVAAATTGNSAALSGATLSGTTASSSLIHVRTDVLDVDIDPRGGDIVQLSLPYYTRTVEDKTPFTMLQKNADQLYVAQSGLVSTDGPDAAAQRPLYSSTANEFVLADDQSTVTVPLHLVTEKGLVVDKVFTFRKGDYLIDITHKVNNATTAPVTLAVYGQIKRDDSKDPAAESAGPGMATYLGGAYWTAEKPYNKLDMEDFSEKPLKQTMQGGWLAWVQHYFVSAWIPDSKQKNHFSSSENKADGTYLLTWTGPASQLAVGSQASFAAQFYAGPKIQEKLQHISPGLDLTVDYGWLWFIAQALFKLLAWIQSIVVNWGVAIIMLTLLVKIALYPLSLASYRSMAKLRKITPEMTRLKEQYGEDRQKMGQAMMELYKKEGVNPLGGCLPILVQMPVFISLYWALMESVELRHAPFFGWIHDLAAMDPYFILPVIMGASMWFQQSLNPEPPDPMQAKVMKLMPVVFSFFFLWFPSGLVLYWVINNLVSIAQQWWINRQIEAA